MAGGSSPDQRDKAPPPRQTGEARWRGGESGPTYCLGLPKLAQSHWVFGGSHSFHTFLGRCTCESAMVRYVPAQLRTSASRWPFSWCDTGHCRRMEGGRHGSCRTGRCNRRCDPRSHCVERAYVRVCWLPRRSGLVNLPAGWFGNLQHQLDAVLSPMPWNGRSVLTRTKICADADCGSNSVAIRRPVVIAPGNASRRVGLPHRIPATAMPSPPKGRRCRCSPDHEPGST